MKPTNPISFRTALEARLLNPASPAKALSPYQVTEQAELRAQFPSAGVGIIVPYIASAAARELAAERRDLSVTGGTSDQYGGALVGNEVIEAAPALLPALRLPSLGARVFHGLVNDANFPYGTTSITAQWLAENAPADDLTEVLGNLSLTPKRVTANVPVSAQLIHQGGPQFTRWLNDELMQALGVEIERVAIAGTGTSNQPRGIINTPGIGSVVGGTNGAAPDLSDLAALEYAVTGTGKADRGQTGWILSPAVRKKLRQTFLNGSGSAPLWSHTESAALLGHPAGVTGSSPDTLTKGSASGICSALIFGNFSELVIGLWGSGIVIDVSASRDFAIAGKVMVTASAYVDVGVRRPAAFACMLDALTA